MWQTYWSCYTPGGQAKVKTEKTQHLNLQSSANSLWTDGPRIMCPSEWKTPLTIWRISHHVWSPPVYDDVAAERSSRRNHEVDSQLRFRTCRTDGTEGQWAKANCKSSPRVSQDQSEGRETHKQAGMKHGCSETLSNTKEERQHSMMSTYSRLQEISDCKRFSSTFKKSKSQYVGSSSYLWALEIWLSKLKMTNS